MTGGAAQVSVAALPNVATTASRGGAKRNVGGSALPLVPTGPLRPRRLPRAPTCAGHVPRRAADDVARTLPVARAGLATPFRGGTLRVRKDPCSREPLHDRHHR